MWILNKLPNKDELHYLICGSSLIVGRIGNENITLVGDKSVSKRHASFFLIHEEQNIGHLEKLPKITLTDLKSSNGTFIKLQSGDFTRLSPEHPENLSHGSIIRFGKENLWRVLHKPFVVTTSMVEKETKISVKKSLQILGGHLVKEWRGECKYLVMDGLKLSAKTVSALASGAYIITPSYLCSLIKAIQENSPIPDPKDYLPPLQELSIDGAEVSFLPDPTRKSLFRGKTFLFLTENSLKRMSAIVQAAGGDPELLTKDNVAKVVLEDNVLVKPLEKEIHDLEKDFFQKAVDLLNENQLSMVPESDIGLAISYKSLVKYCNPKFKVNGILRSRVNPSQMSQSLKIYATETQPDTMCFPSHPISRTTIPETGASSKSKTSPVNRFNSDASPKPLSEKSKAESPKASLPPVTPLGNKENRGKRKRLPTIQNTSPSAKRFSACQGGGRGFSDTEVMEQTNDEVDDIASFNPVHVSSRKEAPKEPEDHFVPPDPVTPKQSRAKNVRMAPSPQGSSGKLNSSVPTSSCMSSIPFEPYTLPSIPVDNLDPVDFSLPSEEETQQFGGPSFFKDEPLSQQDKEPDDPTVVVGIDKNASTLVAETPATPVSSRKESTVVEEIIPQVGRRSAGVAVDDGFALPFKSQRRKRLLEQPSPIEENIQKLKQVKLESDSNPTEGANVLESDVKRLRSVEGNESNRVPPGDVQKENDQPFISKENFVKQKVEEDEMSELEAALEDSLVMVQVVPLVKKIDVVPSTKTLPNGIPNFKKFKKVSRSGGEEPQTEVEMLPRIIGGADLFQHSEHPTRQETYLASQTDVLEEIREADRRKRELEQLDAEFCLVKPRPGPSQRKRGRL